MKEEWRSVPGFPAYMVSDQGRVWSAHCRRVLKPGRMPSGHLSVALGRGNSRCVHELVLIAFVGPRPPKHEARHRDGDPAHNALLNLQWATRGRNGQDKKWHAGARTYKLSAQRAAELKRELDAGTPRKELVDRFGVSKSTVDQIAQGVFHRDV